MNLDSSNPWSWISGIFIGGLIASLIAKLAGGMSPSDQLSS